jgi:hypothetical protein
MRVTFRIGWNPVMVFCTERDLRRRDQFGLSLCKIVRSSVILLLPLFSVQKARVMVFNASFNHISPAVTVTVFKYRNKIGKIVVKAVPYSVT